MKEKDKKSVQKDELNSVKNVAPKTTNKVASKSDKNIDNKTDEVSKLIKSIKSNESKTPVLKPKKSMRAKVALISSATVAVAGGAIGAAVYVANQNKEYVVTMYYEGNVMSEMKANKVSDLKAPEVPGYSFAGWYKDPSYKVPYKSSTRFEENSSVFGKYTPISYEVNFVNWDNSLSEKKTIAYESEFYFPAPSKSMEGYKFVGWALSKEETDASKIFKQNAKSTLNEIDGQTYYAIWGLDQFDLTIEYGADVFGSPENATIADIFYRAEIQNLLDWSIKYKDGSKYLYGYEVNGTTYMKNQTIFMPSKNVTAKPVFAYSQVKVKLNLNGAGDQGEGFVKDYTMSYDSDGTKSQTLGIPVRENYNFLGWARTSDGQVVTIDNVFTLDETQDEHNEVVNLYAIWQAKEYTNQITIVNSEYGTIKLGQEAITSITANYNDAVSKSGNDIFVGDQVINVIPNTNDFKATYYVKITLSENKWTNSTEIKVEFTQTFIQYQINLNTGVAQDEDYVSSYTLSYASSDTASKELNSPLKTGYTFLGWAKTKDSATADFAVDTEGKVIFALPDSQEEFDELGMSNKTLNLFAVWQINTYTIDVSYVGQEYGSLRDKDGNIINRITATFGDQVIVNTQNNTLSVADQVFTAKINNQNFGETYTISIKVDNSTAITTWKEDTKIKVEFSVSYKELTLNLDLNGAGEQADGFISSYNMSYNPTEKSVSINTPTREGYVFKGWSTNNKKQYKQIEITAENFDKYKDCIYVYGGKCYPEPSINEYYRIFFESFEEYSLNLSGLIELDGFTGPYVLDVGYEYSNSDIEYTLTNETNDITLYAVWETQIQIVSVEFNVVESESISGATMPRLNTINYKVPYGTPVDIYSTLYWGMYELYIDFDDSETDGFIEGMWAPTQSERPPAFYVLFDYFEEDEYAPKAVYKSLDNGTTWNKIGEVDFQLRDTIQSDVKLKIDMELTENPMAFLYQINTKSNGYYKDPEVNNIKMDTSEIFGGYDKVVFPVATESSGKYDFLGWTFTDGGRDVKFEAGKEYTMAQLKEICKNDYPSGDYYIYPVWKAKEYTLTIDQTVQEGKTYTGSPVVVTEKYGNKYTLPTLECSVDGYFLSGYKVGQKTYAPGEKVIVEDNITFTPIWSSEYAISFAVNNSNINVENVTKYLTPDLNTKIAKSSIDAIKPTFTDEKGMYTFLGWAETSTGEVIADTSVEIEFSGPKTYFAIWEQVQFNVSFSVKLSGNNTTDTPLSGQPAPSFNESFTITAGNTLSFEQEWNGQPRYADFKLGENRFSIGDSNYDYIGKQDYWKFQNVRYSTDAGTSWTALNENATLNITANMRVEVEFVVASVQYVVVFQDTEDYYFGDPKMEVAPTQYGYSAYNTLTLPDAVADVNGNYDFVGWKYVYGSEDIVFSAGQTLTFEDLDFVEYLDIALEPVWQAKELELKILFGQRFYDEWTDETGELDNSIKLGKILLDGEEVEPGATFTVPYGTSIPYISGPLSSGSSSSIGDHKLSFVYTYDNQYARLYYWTLRFSNESQKYDSNTNRLIKSGQISIEVTISYDDVTLNYAHSFAPFMSEEYILGLSSTSITNGWNNIVDMTLPTLTYDWEGSWDESDRYVFRGWSIAPQCKGGDEYTADELYHDGSIINAEGYTGTIYSIWEHSFTEDYLVYVDPDFDVTCQYYIGDDSDNLITLTGNEFSVSKRACDPKYVEINDKTVVVTICDYFSNNVREKYTFTFDFDKFDTNKGVLYHLISMSGYEYDKSPVVVDRMTLSREVSFVEFNDDNPTQVEYGSKITAPGLYEKPFFTFMGWNTNADGTGTMFNVGVEISTDDLSIFDDVTLPEINYWWEAYDKYIQIKLYPIYEAHTYTLSFSSVPGWVASVPEDITFTYEPGLVIDLPEIEYEKGYSGYGYVFDDFAEYTESKLVFDSVNSNYPDGHVFYCWVPGERYIDFTIDSTLTPAEQTFGALSSSNIYNGTAGGYYTENVAWPYIIMGTQGVHESWEDENGNEDPEHRFEAMYVLPKIERENYTLLGYSRTKNGTPSWYIEITADEYIDSLTIYPIWQGNERSVMVSGHEWVNVYPYLAYETYRQGDTITLPSDLSEIQAIEQYKYSNIKGFIYKGEKYAPGATIVVNETDHVPYIVLDLDLEAKYASVEFELGGGTSDLEDMAQVALGTMITGTATPPTNKQYFSSWNVYLNGELVATAISGYTLTSEGNYRFEAIYMDIVFLYQFTSNIDGVTLPEFNAAGFMLGVGENASNNIVLNYNESDFECEGYKLSHFEFNRNGVIETAQLGGTFHNVTEIIPNDNNDRHTFTIKAVFVKEDQLLTFHTVTTPDELECTNYLGKNLFNNALPYIDLTTRIGSKAKLLEGLAAGQTIFLGYNCAKTVGVENTVFSQANIVTVIIPIKNNTTYTITGKIKQKVCLIDENFITVKSELNKTITNDVNAKYLAYYTSNMAQYNQGTQKYTNDEVLSITQIEEGTVATEYEPYGTRHQEAISVNKADITAENAYKYDGAIFTIPSAVEKEKTVNGVTQYFVGWSTDEDATTVEYYPGDTWTYDASSALDFYPVYESADEALFTFILNNSSDGYILTGFTEERDDYIIPSEYNGKPVTEIDSYLLFDDSTIGKSLRIIYIPSTVEKIGENAFYGCQNLSMVLFEKDSKLNTIENGAFANCTNLKQIDLPDSLRTIGIESFFQSALTSIVIPEGVIELSENTFFNCSSLKSIEIPEGVTSIGDGVFSYCTSLESIVIPASVTSIGACAFVQCSNLETVLFEENSQLATIGGGAFGFCFGLTSITIPENMIEIFTEEKNKFGNAFYGCTNLKVVHNLSSLDIVKGATTHGYVAYYAVVVTDDPNYQFEIEDNVMYHGTTVIAGINNMSSYKIREGTTEIGEYAFFNTSNLKTIEIPASVTEISRNAFYDCAKLETITFAENSQLTHIRTQVFYGCKALKSIELPESLTHISDEAFWDCRSLTSITFPENITSIGNHTFNSCISLANVEFTSKYSIYIGNGMFAACTSLKTIIIPSNVIEIGDSAFYDCTNLKTVVNLSSLDITKGHATHGYVAHYADKVITADVVENGIAYTISDGEVAAIAVLDKTLSTYTLREDTTIIGSDLFVECLAMESIVIPDSVKTIQGYAFYNLANLREVKLSNSLTTIGNYAFAACNSLETIIIPENVTSIGTKAFYNCTNLRNVMNLSDLTIISSVTDDSVGQLGLYANIVLKNEVIWSDSTINGVVYRTYTSKDGGNVKFVTKDNTSVQEQSSFKVAIGVEDNTLSTYILADDVDAIGFGAFKNNGNLSYITIPASVKSIAHSAFAGCYGLNVVVNLSNLVIANIAHNASDYGYLTWYLGEVYDYEIDVVENIIDGIKYYDIYAATDTSHNTLIDRIVAGNQDYSSLSGEITLAEGTTVVSYKAFDTATGVTQITLPESVRLIQYRGLGSITNVVLENSSGWEQANADPYANTWSDLTSDEAASAIASKPKFVHRRKG